MHNYNTGSDDPQLPTSKRYDENQQAVIELAKEAEKAGKNGSPIGLSEANILLEWAEEYKIPHHGPEIHPNRPGAASNIWHFHIAKIGNIIIDMLGDI